MRRPGQSVSLSKSSTWTGALALVLLAPLLLSSAKNPAPPSSAEPELLSADVLATARPLPLPHRPVQPQPVSTAASYSPGQPTAVGRSPRRLPPGQPSDLHRTGQRVGFFERLPPVP